MVVFVEVREMSRRGKGGFHRRTPHRRSAVCCSWLCGMHGGPAGDYWSSALAVTATEGKKAVSASPPAGRSAACNDGPECLAGRPATVGTD